MPQEESEILAYLNDSYLEDKLFYKKLSDADLALSIDVLLEEIQFLNFILHKNSGHHKIDPIFLGMIPLLITICLIYKPGQTLYELYNQFVLGKFKDIHIPFHWIEKLSSTIINQEEKEYLKRFSFEKIYFNYKKDPFCRDWSIDPQTGKMKIITQDDIVENTIACLSASENEKIMYLALRSAITDLKREAAIAIGTVLIYLVIGICCCAPFFKKTVFSYEIEDQAKLNLYKTLYNLLKKEYADRSYTYRLIK